MTMLKGGNCVGLVLPDGTKLMNEDGAPLVFLIEDDRGDVHELYLTVGRMGTYTMLAEPPFHLDDQLDARTGDAASSRQRLEDGVPVAARSGRSKRTKTSQV